MSDDELIQPVLTLTRGPGNASAESDDAIVEMLAAVRRTEIRLLPNDPVEEAAQHFADLVTKGAEIVCHPAVADAVRGALRGARLDHLVPRVRAVAWMPFGTLTAIAQPTKRTLPLLEGL